MDQQELKQGITETFQKVKNKIEEGEKVLQEVKSDTTKIPKLEKVIERA